MSAKIKKIIQELLRKRKNLIPLIQDANNIEKLVLHNHIQQRIDF